MYLELITRTPDHQTCKTPLLFVHGAWHGAWCWDEHFLPYFADQGFTVHGISFRNHGKSESKGSLRWRSGAEYVADLAQVVEQMATPPVLVAHSMGGYVVQKYLEKASSPAVVLLASVPPRGAIGATLRFAGRHPLAFLKANLQLRLWPMVSTPALARDAFFSRTMPAEQVERHFPKLQDESYRAFLDLLFNLPRVKKMSKVPMLVLGGHDDKIFSRNEVRSTARAYKAELDIFPEAPHDMMLDTGWQKVADRIISWLRGVPGIC